jgi:hypothetical protein
MVYAYAKGDDGVDACTVQQILDDGVFFAGGAALRAPVGDEGE